jgi:hypothetical protein
MNCGEVKQKAGKLEKPGKVSSFIFALLLAPKVQDEKDEKTQASQ